MGAPSQILELVERFDRNRDEYTSGAYSEAHVRLECIDPRQQGAVPAAD